MGILSNINKQLHIPKKFWTNGVSIERESELGGLNREGSELRGVWIMGGLSWRGLNCPRGLSWKGLNREGSEFGGLRCSGVWIDL